MNVQVGLHKTDQGVHLMLRDAEGVIREVDPSPSEAEPEKERAATGEDKESESSTKVESLHAALTQAEEAIGALQSQVNTLQKELVKESSWVKEFWKLNCLQLAEFDTALEEKDKEIAWLRRHLASPPPPSTSHGPEIPEADA